MSFVIDHSISNMMNPPMFLNNKNNEYFDLNQDHIHEDHQQQVLERCMFHPPSFAVSNISNLHLEQGLGMSADHSMSEQSMAFHQLEGSKNMLLDMVSPTYEAQMTSKNNNYGSQNHEIFIFKQQEDHQDPNNQNKSGSTSIDNNGTSLRWMSSKMRMMRKMINSNDTKNSSRNIGSRIISSNNNPDHCPGQLNVITSDCSNSNANNYGIRVCSDCNTTKTPLWRSGPQGPKTLCNACGIRQRKARKAAMEAAAAAATNNSYEGDSSSTSSKTKIKLKIKEKNKSRVTTSNTCVSQHINKKQTTYNKQQTNTQQLVDSDHTNNSSTSNNSSKRQMFFEEFAVKLLSKNAAFHRMFPQDEEEGALLLMTLSYGFDES